MIGSSAEIQKLVFDTLKGNASIMALANGVYDKVPTSPFGSKTAYISFGPEDAQEEDAECVRSQRLTLQIDIWSRAVGFVECKKLTNLVRQALHEQPLDLTENALLQVRVELSRVFRDPDGETSHGVIQATFTVEEPD